MDFKLMFPDVLGLGGEGCHRGVCSGVRGDIYGLHLGFGVDREGWYIVLYGIR